MLPTDTKTTNQNQQKSQKTQCYKLSNETLNQLSGKHAVETGQLYLLNTPPHHMVKKNVVSEVANTKITHELNRWMSHAAQEGSIGGG